MIISQNNQEKGLADLRAFFISFLVLSTCAGGAFFFCVMQGVIRVGVHFDTVSLRFL